MTARLIRSVPLLGVVVALFTLRSAVRRKGVAGGTIDSALDAIPFVGAAKNVAEMVRGRDFIREKAAAAKMLATMKKNGSRRTRLLHGKDGNPTGPVSVSQMPAKRRLFHSVGAALEEGPAAGRSGRPGSSAVRQAA
jgi:hypothetical protein